MNLTSLWKLYKESNDPVIERHLADIYVYVVQIETKIFWQRFPKKYVDPGDFLGWGSLGLYAAIRRYDVSCGNFERYARYRIRGACLDGMRGEQYWTRKKGFDPNSMVRLDVCSKLTGDPIVELKDKGKNPYEIALENDFLELIEGDNSIEAQVLLLHFKQELFLKEIAVLFGTTASNMSLLLKKAVRKYVKRQRINELMSIYLMSLRNKTCRR